MIKLRKHNATSASVAAKDAVSNSNYEKERDRDYYSGGRDRNYDKQKEIRSSVSSDRDRDRDRGSIALSSSSRLQQVRFQNISPHIKSNTHSTQHTAHHYSSFNLSEQ